MVKAYNTQGSDKGGSIKHDVEAVRTAAFSYVKLFSYFNENRAFYNITGANELKLTWIPLDATCEEAKETLLDSNETDLLTSFAEGTKLYNEEYKMTDAEQAAITTGVQSIAVNVANRFGVNQHLVAQIPSQMPRQDFKNLLHRARGTMENISGVSVMHSRYLREAEHLLLSAYVPGSDARRFLETIGSALIQGAEYIKDPKKRDGCENMALYLKVAAYKLENPKEPSLRSFLTKLLHQEAALTLS